MLLGEPESTERKREGKMFLSEISDERGIAHYNVYSLVQVDDDTIFIDNGHG